MDQRIFHGNLTEEEVGDALVAYFTRGNLVAQQFKSGEKVIVQVATHRMPTSGGQTALTVSLQPVEDGLAVQVGEQSWLGVAASLGTTLFSTWRNPLNILNRLDDLAQDIENLQLSDQIWRVVENVAHMKGASFELSERLRRLVCDYCLTANPVGEPSCTACGAPLGPVQPMTCQNCGFVVNTDESLCPNCKQPL